MSSYKVLFLDIDGTVLQDDHTIATSTKKAVQQAKAKGIEVFLATGRPLHEISDIADSLDIHSFIGYNGAYAIYEDQVVFNQPIDSTIIEHFLQVAHQNGHEMVLYTNQLNLFTSLTPDFVQRFADYFNFQQNFLYTDQYKQNILGITMMNVKPNETALYDLPKSDIYFSEVNVSGVDDCYDVIRENVNKGRAIKTVLERLEIEAHQAIAFGDGMNDKQMLQFVGESFAMGNAHEELFQYAKHRTTSVNNDGIYHGLQSLGIVP
ncbi:hydrolase [Gracilibacillus halophilus YIM-C55.5]|uniref:Hydrolase n=1 Tax=Gracilibacillus halophilus YIM-C55.5 TaxID=1308866 RepID=N4WC71_9BACI|nr:HAD family hydrolase [Gracilibacillus halophilus]ENH97883.1 hydrolase [Gracilibacillus halophilus YIM-C55.5]